jgi:hypothetical protein
VLTYIFLQTGSLVRIEGILTQLVFEHSLRIRLVEKPKLDAPTSGSRSGTTTPGAPGSPKKATASEATTVLDSDSDRDGEDDGEGRERGGSDGSETIAASVSHSVSASAASATTAVAGGTMEGIGKKKGPAPTSGKGDPPPAPTSTAAVAAANATTEKDEDKDKDGNLIGKINNLVTVDTNNIVDGRDFLFVRAYFGLFSLFNTQALILGCVVWNAPLELALCAFFLWKVLEWR